MVYLLVGSILASVPVRYDRSLSMRSAPHLAFSVVGRISTDYFEWIHLGFVAALHQDLLQRRLGLNPKTLPFAESNQPPP
jgi:hypothetical protein